MCPTSKATTSTLVITFGHEKGALISLIQKAIKWRCGMVRL